MRANLGLTQLLLSLGVSGMARVQFGMTTDPGESIGASHRVMGGCIALGGIVIQRLYLW